MIPFCCFYHVSNDLLRPQTQLICGTAFAFRRRQLDGLVLCLPTSLYVTEYGINMKYARSLRLAPIQCNASSINALTRQIVRTWRDSN